MDRKKGSTLPERNGRDAFFKGYPYLVVHIPGGIYHIHVLSAEHNTAEEIMTLAQAQADANKFEVCLVLEENGGVYFSSRFRPRFSKRIPRGGIFVSGSLELSAEQRVTEDLLNRKRELEIFIERTNPPAGYLTGDILKGGREASYEELICLRGVQGNGLPKGLGVCPLCGDHRGECLDPGQGLRGLIVRISCHCANDNLCARCGGKLSGRKPGSNHYEARGGQVWHTPPFSALSHRCPVAQKQSR